MYSVLSVCCLNQDNAHSAILKRFYTSVTQKKRTDLSCRPLQILPCGRHVKGLDGQRWPASVSWTRRLQRCQSTTFHPPHNPGTVAPSAALQRSSDCAPTHRSARDRWVWTDEFIHHVASVPNSTNLRNIWTWHDCDEWLVPLVVTTRGKHKNEEKEGETTITIILKGWMG